MLGLLVLLLLSVGAGWAAELTAVRVFSGEGHARLLVLYTGEAPAIRTRALPAIGTAPPRAILLLDGATLGAISSAEVGQNGVLRLDVQQISDSAQLSVLLDTPRAVRAAPLTEGAILVDLIEEGRGEDPTLPGPDQLRTWMEGVALAPREPTAPLTAPQGQRVIVVDAGHGGWDHGAVGVTGTREADVALQIARRVAARLEQDLGAKVILTREDDTFIPLQQRAAIANVNGADLFLSIHANAAPGPTAWGIETYSMDTASDAAADRVARRENALALTDASGEANLLLGKLLADGTSQLSRELAISIQSTVVDQLRRRYGDEQVRDLGAKTALFYVLVSTRMPAVLFEASFVSNSHDERMLRTPHFQDAVAESIALAVKDWLDSQQ